MRNYITISKDADGLRCEQDDSEAVGAQLQPMGAGNGRQPPEAHAGETHRLDLIVHARQRCAPLRDYKDKGTSPGSRRSCCALVSCISHNLGVEDKAKYIIRAQESESCFLGTDSLVRKCVPSEQLLKHQHVQEKRALRLMVEQYQDEHQLQQRQGNFRVPQRTLRMRGNVSTAATRRAARR